MNNFGIKSFFLLTLLAVMTLILFQCTTPSILVTREQQKGDYYNNQNQYEEAIRHYQNSLDAGEKLGSLRNLDMEADICRKIATAYAFQGKFDNALKYVAKALVSDSVHNNRLEGIEDYRLLGKLNLYKGDFQSGIPNLEHALDLNKGMESSLKGLNKQSIADTYLSLAQV